jgi:uncharacterized protein YgbK (DUF1537 family)
MIFCFADDLSGAAEIAGIAWRYGLRTVVQTGAQTHNQADITIIDNNTRSKNQTEAHREFNNCVKFLSNIKADWFYKKTDSLLRGHVLAELEILLENFKKKSVLLIPANPSAGRIIKNGLYYLNEVLLHETSFVFDPEYPRNVSDILSLLGSSEKYKPQFLNMNEKIHAAGIFVGNCEDKKDLEYWVLQLNDEIIPAGGSEFFEAVLRLKTNKTEERKEDKFPSLPGGRLVILGSSSEQSRENLAMMEEKGICICRLPDSITSKADLTDGVLQNWITQIVTALKRTKTVIAAGNQLLIAEPDFRLILVDFFVKMVKEVYRKIRLQQLVIEGGTTASKIIRSLGIQRMNPVFEYLMGLVLLRAHGTTDLHVIVKPGSYPWPDKFWSNYS